ncbi:MAG: hypothetical protein ABSB42_16695 [Tepidisphaeraceae bacterium]|jgi:hypothetical protein
MSDHITATIEELQAEIRPMEEKIVKTKQLINMLCERAGTALLYPEAELTVQDSSTKISRGDEFFNKPLNTCLKSVLTRLKAIGRTPATAEQIYDLLLLGGYDKFPPKKDDAMNGLRISLGKSTHTFVKLPNGAYGLCEWYDMKKPKAKAEEKSEDQPVEESTAEPEANGDKKEDIFDLNGKAE